MTRAHAVCAALSLAASCGAPRSDRVAKPTPSDVGARAWHYEVTPGEGARTLAIVATFAGPTRERFDVEAGARTFVRDVEYAERDAWRPVPLSGTGWSIPSCARGCTVRYRFMLADAATQIGDPDTAGRFGDILVAPPPTWTLRPTDAADTTNIRIHVDCPKAIRCAVGLDHAADGAADTYVTDRSRLYFAGYAAFGPLRIRDVAIGGAHLALATPAAGMGLTDEVLAQWARVAGDAIRGFYGKLPDHVLILAVPGGNSGIDGETLGLSIRMTIDKTKTTIGESSWVLAHELVHASSPSLGWPHRWLEEGLATYVEPVARAATGEVSAARVWADMIEGLPQGEPQAGDEGLERTHTWGRTYWGGAMFCLLADVEIRERTHGAKSLRDVMRAMVALHANASVNWPIEKFIEVGDAATGVTVLRELYDKLGHTPTNVDLPALYKKLGVEMKGGVVAFDDAAPLSSVRRGITDAR